jgi:hypothetical protein
MMAHRYLIAGVLAATVGVVAPACASRTYSYRNDGYTYRQQVDRRAFDFGYREGLEHGRRDARDRRSFSFQRHDEFRDADAGYRRADGNLERYRRDYRAGFERGYTVGFRQYR